MKAIFQRWRAYWWIITHRHQWDEFLRAIEALTEATRALEKATGQMLAEQEKEPL